MSAATCHYCDKGESMAAIGVEIGKLSVSTLYLHKEQSHPGRIIVTYNEHVGDIIDLTETQLNAYMADVVKTAKAIHAVYNPEKINYGAFGDNLRHLHFHLVPKYRDKFEWGGIFAMNPQLVTLADAEYAEAVKKLQKALGSK